MRDVLDQSLFIFGSKQLLPSVVCSDAATERCIAFLKFSGKCINFVSNLPRTLSAFSFTSLEIPISVQSLDVNILVLYHVLALGQEHLFSPERQHVGLSHTEWGWARAKDPG